MKNYEIVLYRNVTQNESGLWSVDRVSTNKFIQVSDKTKPKDICNKLVDMDILASSNMRTLYLTDITKDIVEIKEKKGMKPICRLERSFC